MILMIDNYDSFTYNLVQYVGEIYGDITVRRNDEVTIDEIREMDPDAILLSPGPCSPNEAGVCLEVVRQFAGVTPILGVCLGHQTIIQAFGGEVGRAKELFHGKTSLVLHDGRSLFNQIPLPFTVARYHSLIGNEVTLPDSLEVTARTPSGDLMGVRHVDFAVEGVQFHPESILTEHGKKLLQNFLDYYEVGFSEKATVQ
ncbi:MULTISPECIES: anthranilate synthase component II [Pontibacillus]|uniref:Aminodeoxychorismate/anthranilate synthase component II n=1 Tax=Pontibacillus chungwhensis TaxID=265426 RepID=A0ABY8UY98_9BACI|nr:MULTISPECIES: aminodeoxychorismate/anthranilate synthase component II [Pontibacillus]MCD5325517.1 aminodeoxychorismate/anthranilate synthase component II [Pontibacillus sp. HN14]WIF98627.1 aminodeoxychorismate/anthranilate synthase component II [Pontibacillus chungwhensis]